MLPKAKNKMKLLLLEDDLVDQMAFKRWMAKELSACHLSIASSIEEGKTSIQGNDFDLFICDFFLPDGDISDFLKWVDPAQVICISGISDPKQLQRIKTLGINQFFFKDPQLNYLQQLKNHILYLNKAKQEKKTTPSTAPLSSSTKPQLEHLKKTFDNNPAPIKDIIQIFLEQTPEQLAALKKAVLEKTPKTCHALAHRLKSNFRMMGLHKSMKKLEEIEGTYSDVAKKHQHFINMVEEIQAEAQLAYQSLHKELETL